MIFPKGHLPRGSRKRSWPAEPAAGPRAHNFPTGQGPGAVNGVRGEAERSPKGDPQKQSLRPGPSPPFQISEGSGPSFGRQGGRPERRWPLAGFRLFPRAGSRASRPPRGRAPRGRARVLPGAGTRREGTRVPCPAQGCLPASLTVAAWASAGPSGSDESALSSLPEPAPGVSGSPRAT